LTTEEEFHSAGRSVLLGQGQDMARAHAPELPRSLTEAHPTGTAPGAKMPAVEGRIQSNRQPSLTLPAPEE
jgi:hypothetical protein